ncbi:AAA family ATPase [Bacillus salinus]|uniref:AAA family ATPase n=1 Tax=Bacillus sp. HMF5848 TaxID=2495421 RepID=UPI00163A9AD3|nr:AAA family ATPase [Bacillus sp. HMF5848]
MIIHELELQNFTCHAYEKFQFSSDANHFFGDNFAGKSSIGAAIVFCLFGVTKHGYKTYVKDYVQQGQANMKVSLVFSLRNATYHITRNLTSNGTAKIYLNQKLVKEQDVIDIVGDYKPFVYRFYPESFVEEKSSTARHFIIEVITGGDDTFDQLEQEKSNIARQQRQADSSKAYYEGQKALLRKQLDSYTAQEQDNHMDKQQQELILKAQQILNEITLLTDKISYLKEELSKSQMNRQAIQDCCPTCEQKIPLEVAERLHADYFKNEKDIQEKIDELMKQVSNKKVEHQQILSQQEELKQHTQMISTPTEDKAFHTLKVEYKRVQEQLNELTQQKNMLSEQVKQIKQNMGSLANQYQTEVNKHLMFTEIHLFKSLKNGDLRPDFQILYKDRPYRTLSKSEKVRCSLEIVQFLNSRYPDNPCPIFLDNLESVTHLTPPNTQVITATVKKGMPLTLKVK